MNSFWQTFPIYLNCGLAVLLVITIFLRRRASSRHRQEVEPLRESEKKYAAMVKSFPTIIFKGYADGTAEFFANRFETLTGYPVADFNSCKMKWQDLIVPEDVERVKDAFRLALKTNKSYTREYRIQAASGAIRWIQERGQIVCGDDGRLDFVTGICTDITMQREMYATLQENERNFRLLINTLPSIVFKGYSDFSVEFFDDKIEKLLGYPAMDFNTRQRKWQEIIFPDDLDRAKEIMKQALKGDKSYVREYRIQAKSGEILRRAKFDRALPRRRVRNRPRPGSLDGLSARNARLHASAPLRLPANIGASRR